MQLPPSTLRPLRNAEQQISLLQRCVPLNLEQEVHRVSRRAMSGLATDFEFRYYPVPQLGALRGFLNRLAQETTAPWLPLAQRAQELLLEVEMVESLGAPQFERLARRRFGLYQAATAPTPAREWLQWSASAHTARELIRCDSPQPASLRSQLQRLIGKHRLPIRVRVTSRLQSVAATGDGCVWLRAGTSLCALESKRVAVHEILGHALRFCRAHEHPHPLALVGFARSVEDEEGWAVWQEHRSGVLHDTRKRQLALRHLAAQRCLSRRPLTETLRWLHEQGLTWEAGTRLCARILRGGGLYRELIYLPGWLRVSEALALDPTLEQTMQLGRVSLQAAAELASVHAQ